MKTIIHFIDTLKGLFERADIGAYFVPMFRPMVREQDRLHPIRVVLVRSGSLSTFSSPSVYEWPNRS